LPARGATGSQASRCARWQAESHGAGAQTDVTARLRRTSAHQRHDLRSRAWAASDPGRSPRTPVWGRSPDRRRGQPLVARRDHARGPPARPTVPTPLPPLVAWSLQQLHGPNAMLRPGAARLGGHARVNHVPEMSDRTSGTDIPVVDLALARARHVVVYPLVFKADSLALRSTGIAASRPAQTDSKCPLPKGVSDVA
jgi:hypothetical protein